MNRRPSVPTIWWRDFYRKIRLPDGWEMALRNLGLLAAILMAAFALIGTWQIRSDLTRIREEESRQALLESRIIQRAENVAGHIESLRKITLGLLAHPNPDTVAKKYKSQIRYHYRHAQNGINCLMELIQELPHVYEWHYTTRDSLITKHLELQNNYFNAVERRGVSIYEYVERDSLARRSKLPCSDAIVLPLPTPRIWPELAKELRIR